MDKTGEIRPDTMENLFSLWTVRTSLTKAIIITQEHLGQSLINFLGPSSVGLVLKKKIVNRTEDLFLIATLVQRPVLTRSQSKKYALIGPPMGPHPRKLQRNGASRARHRHTPRGAVGCEPDRLHGYWFITCWFIGMCSCVTITFVYSEWHQDGHIFWSDAARWRCWRERSRRIMAWGMP